MSVANVAHIIGHGSSGPRSEHDLAEYIERDGQDNLLMLCLDCHKTVDELERRFSVETMRGWKAAHALRISSLFAVPRIADERQLLIDINELLDANSAIFHEYGPYSDNVLNGEGGDGLRIWRRRCLDTIIPNNQRIVLLIENNKRNFPYPWEVYAQMLSFRLHVEAFQDNCLTNKRVNDYKLFPRSFDHFVKTKLGIHSVRPEIRAREELEFRYSQIRTYIERFLAKHSSIESLEELNRGTMLVNLRDGRALKVFVTNTYYFTEYTLDRVLEVDPAVDAIICSGPAGQYADAAKRICIEKGIGLFMIGEFMGALRHSGEQYLNFLLRSECDARTSDFKRTISDSLPPPGVRVFAFGSYLRRKLFRDIDVLVVYAEPTDINAVKRFESGLTTEVRKALGEPHITVSSEREFRALKLDHNNLQQVYP